VHRLGRATIAGALWAMAPEASCAENDVTTRLFAVPADERIDAAVALARPATPTPLPHSLGITDAVTWAILDLDLSAVADPVLDLGQSSFDVANLHERLADGSWRVHRAGLRVDWTARELRHWNTAFLLSPDADAWVLELRGVQPMTLSPDVLPRTEWEDQVQVERLSTALFLGALLVMAAYNAFLYLALRDRSYLYYVATVLFLHAGVATVGCGMHYALLGPGHADLARLAIRTMIGLCMISVAAFGATYLDTRRMHPTWHRAYTAYGALGVVGLATSLALPDSTLGSYPLLLGMPTLTFLLIGSGISAYRAGNLPARYFVTAWAVYSVAMFALAAAETGLLGNASVLASPEWLRPLMRAGSVAEVLLLSFALADRIAILQGERLRANEESLLAERRARAAEERTATTHREFLAVMSHELRTPLNGVIGGAEVLCGTDLAPDQQEIVQTITTSAESLLGTLQDILDYTSATAGNAEVFSRFDLEEVVTAAAAPWRALAERKGIRWDFVVEAPTALVDGPLTCVRRVTAELTENAAKFCETGTISVRTRVTSDGAIVVEVRDTGPGIPADRLRELFQPFAVGATHSARTAGGTGLGLALARRISDACGATLTLESEPGRGTTARLVVPTAALAAA
jgi:signal transduction histidine kinase